MATAKQTQADLIYDVMFCTLHIPIISRHNIYTEAQNVQTLALLWPCNHCHGCTHTHLCLWPSLVPRPSYTCEKEGLVFWPTFLVTAAQSESSNQIAECVIICKDAGNQVRDSVCMQCMGDGIITSLNPAHVISCSEHQTLFLLFRGAILAQDYNWPFHSIPYYTPIVSSCTQGWVGTHEVYVQIYIITRIIKLLVCWVYVLSVWHQQNRFNLFHVTCKVGDLGGPWKLTQGTVHHLVPLVDVCRQRQREEGCSYRGHSVHCTLHPWSY